MKWNEKLKQVRKRLGLTLVEVETKLECPPYLVHRIETGENENPGILTVLKITNLYDVGIDEIMY